ncbi:hypothetical protein GCK72_017193 [Caenorhabditis remanei]|uniref:CX domain-containing protein n=1 Tax=Caenorhabditis remanei TaxID=31234 RepID=A0A6A5G7L1_CAERE|nr:hypothetical protein GCK72_017193 [Caenorhabditis remanei]KAF1750642.1 hypothetical protein GCK72_017193 [Caenorhabditis remanei]
MNISSFILLFSSLLLYEINAKSGGGGGRGGGGRGSSGARSSSRSFSKSGSSGGGKFHSSSSQTTYQNFDSSAFRSNVFTPSRSSTYFTTGGTTGNTYIISQPATPIIYDNHHYYWHGYYRSRPEKETYCEYAIGDEDGELRNVTFANGTSPKFLTFGCGHYERCCGMTCCSMLGDFLGTIIWLAMFGVAIWLCCCKN